MISLLLVSLVWMTGQEVAANERPDLEFRPELVAETKAWAHDAKVEIERSLQFAERQHLDLQAEHLRRTLDNILRDSDKQNESLMRFVLYRAQVIHNIMKEDGDGPKQQATSRRFLRDVLVLAESKYKRDQSLFETMQKEKNPMRPVDFALLGLEWMNFVMEYHYQLSTNRARFAVLKQSLVIWMNDTAKDEVRNRELAPVTYSLAQFYEGLQDRDPQTNLETLILGREISTFVRDELKIAKRILGPMDIANTEKGVVENVPGLGELFCKGQIIYHPVKLYSRSGKIVAISSGADEVTVRREGHDSLHRFPPRLAAYAYGCAGGVCVGDTVYHTKLNSDSGQVLGIFLNGYQVVTSRAGQSGLYTLDVKTISIGTRTSNYSEKLRSSWSFADKNLLKKFSGCSNTTE